MGDDHGGQTPGPVTRVFVHVGAPKTGTTFLQRAWWGNREQLADDGLLYPFVEPFEHFAATMDLREMTWGEGYRDPAWEGAWDRVAQRVRDWHGSAAIVSNELLGGATAEQARRAVETFGDAEVHVVFTARDLARQLPSDWQEQVKHMHTITLQQFVDNLVELGIEAPWPFGPMFWGLHDPVRVLGTWSQAVPAERIHVVTVPQRGGPPNTLWDRMSGLLGVEPDKYNTSDAATNTSMGTLETEFLRRLNMVLGHRTGRHYDQLVRVRLAEGMLVHRPGQQRTELPREHHDWVVRRSEELVDGIRAAHYDVVGDLDELIPPPLDGPGPTPAHQADSQAVAEVAVYAIARLLENAWGLQRRLTQVRHDLAEERKHQPAPELPQQAVES